MCTDPCSGRLTTDTPAGPSTPTRGSSATDCYCWEMENCPKSGRTPRKRETTVLTIMRKHLLKKSVLGKEEREEKKDRLTSEEEKVQV